MEELASCALLVFPTLEDMAANGSLIHNDDTSDAEVRCARFKGSSRAEFIDRLDIEGSILAAIDEVPKFIRRNTKMAGKFGAMQRRDISEYPAEGIREALTNALAHANYEVSGGRIFVAIL